MNNLKKITNMDFNYSRPMFKRDNYISLDGEWDFIFDEENIGDKAGYQNGFISNKKINVPFAYQSMMSGINDPHEYKIIWYQKKFNFNKLEDEDLLLHLEGSDYKTTVYLNGVLIGSDMGAYHRQSYNLSKALKEENLLVIKVEDDYKEEYSRGKQRAKDTDYGCWYIDTSGIFKPVWLEKVNITRINNVKFTPNITNYSCLVDLSLDGELINKKLNVQILFNNELVDEVNIVDLKKQLKLTVDCSKDVHLWKLGEGNLYDVVLTLYDDTKEYDKVTSYFGLREIKIDGDQILLNNEPLYQKLILDQGYYKGADLSVPNPAYFEEDIQNIMAMGFNGARLHEKVEDERMMALADQYGFLLWLEIPSFYKFNEESCSLYEQELPKIINQYYNHPSIITIVLFNESWGINDVETSLITQNFVDKMYDLTKSIDMTRPVITNDGWMHTKSDIISLHQYTQDGNEMYEFFNTLDKCLSGTKDSIHFRHTFCEGYSYKGQPIMITEFGGTAFIKDINGNKWGYGTNVADDSDFLNRFNSLVSAITNIPFIRGYCYTQYTDVYHEVNGLLDFDRKFKINPDKIKEIIDK